MSGAIIGGFVHERYYKHSELILACALWLGAISTLIIPFGAHLAVVATMFGFSGIAEGLIDYSKTRTHTRPFAIDIYTSKNYVY